tara:strand:+ start:304 stop:573 length:270 start_codon:yes stop_codon:yes gene_type:complete
MKERTFSHLGKRMTEKRDSHGNLIGYIYEDPKEEKLDNLSNGSLDAEKQLFDFIENWADQTVYTKQSTDRVIYAHKDNFKIKIIFKKNT